MWNSRPPPPFMEKNILNFHFDYWNPSLNPKEEGHDNDHNDDDDYHDEGDIYHSDDKDEDDNDKKGNAAATLLKRKLIKRNLSRL